MKSKFIKSIIFAAAVSGSIVSWAAVPVAVVISPPWAAATATLGEQLSEAKRLDALGNYRGVIDNLIAIYDASDFPLPAESEKEWLYLLGKAFYETSDPRALTLLEKFTTEWPAASEALNARFLTADFYFFLHKWSDALERYRALDCKVMDSAQRDLYTYREALCLIKCGFFNEAQPLLSSLINSKEYASRAKYYEAYICYVNGEDKRAMTLFREVEKAMPEDEPELCPSYYIAQLLFRQGKWDECERLASSLLKKNINPSLAVDTRRIYGLSRYKIGDYTAALPILERYSDEAGEDAYHDALYALGVCQYDAHELDKAEQNFSRVAEDHDVIGQGAALYLGQIAARRGESDAAAMNFERAYRMNYDNKVAESALYDYVVALANGGNVPFDSNAGMLEEFIRNYPNSDYAPVIERHLACLYYNEGDYDNALRVARKIKHPSKDDIALLQMILYSGGSSALSSGNPDKAADLLEKCVAISNADSKVRNQARIWLADALYQQKKYRQAEQQYDAALRSGESDDNTLHARYALGYSQMMQNRFREASSTFSRLLSSIDLPEELGRDARLRIADCKYYTGNYAAAKSDFATLKSQGHSADYASYRHAQILGIEGDLNGKISELLSLEHNFNGSKWMPNVLKELADTYIALGQPSKAADTYSRMLHRYPVDAAAPEAQLGMASALMDTGDAAAAAKAYREILQKWPSSKESRLADAALREYYAESGNLSDYARFLSSIPGFSLNASEMDELAYSAAERQFLNNSSSVSPLQKYLKDYPSGLHAAEAWSLLARHYYDNKDKGNALNAYRELERRGGAEYAVEAYTGIMRTADNSGLRSDYARRLISTGGASTEALEEAEFYVAEASLNGKNTSEEQEAERVLRRLAKNPFSEFGAHSAVTIAESMLRKNKPGEALKIMEEFTSSGSEQQYWVARGFIVMADAYTALGDKYMAREYLQSLKRNYPGKEADIRAAIEQRLK